MGGWYPAPCEPAAFLPKPWQMPLGVGGRGRGGAARTARNRRSLRSRGGTDPRALEPGPRSRGGGPAPQPGAGPRVTSVPAGTQDGCAPVEVTFEWGRELGLAAHGGPVVVPDVLVTAVDPVPGQGKGPWVWRPRPDSWGPAAPAAPRRSRPLARYLPLTLCRGVARLSSLSASPPETSPDHCPLRPGPSSEKRNTSLPRSYCALLRTAAVSDCRVSQQNQ